MKAKIETKDKFRLEVKDGHWYGRIHVSDSGVQTWCALGKIESVTPKDAGGCARLSKWYYLAGILHTITTPIMRQTETDIIDVIGKKDGVLFITTDGKTTKPFDAAAEVAYKETIGK